MDLEQAYLFRHALLRDAAYALQPPSERAQLHRLAVESLQAVMPVQLADSLAVELADHCRAAREGSKTEDQKYLEQIEQEFLKTAIRHATRREDNVELVELLLRLADLIPSPLKARIDLLARAGGVCMGLSALAQAERIAHRMLLLARQAGDEPQQARSLRALMAVEATLGCAAEADLHIRQSLEILRRHDDKRELATTLLAVALQNLARGNHEQARVWLQQSLDCKGVGTEIEAKARIALADLELASGNAEAALACYRQAAEMRAAIGDIGGERTASQGQARSLVKLGRLPEAEALASRLAAELRATGKLAGEANMRVVLAEIEFARGNLLGAVAIHQEVLQARLGEGSVWHLIDARSSLAESLCAVGRFDDALPHATESERLCREQGMATGLARALSLQGMILHQQGKWTEAAARLSAALELAGKSDRQPEIAERLAQVRRQIAANGKRDN